LRRQAHEIFWRFVYDGGAASAGRCGVGCDVLRGGSWINNNDNARAVSRNINNHPSDRNNNIGFRVSCAGRPTSLRPLLWNCTRVHFELRFFHQKTAAFSIAGRARFASRDEEI
jgi:hypothetical protein